MNMTWVTTTCKGVAALIVACLLSFEVAAGADSTVSVTASADVMGSNNVAVHFTLKNLGQTPLEFGDAELPWSAQASTVIVYWGRGGLGHTLKKWRMVEDPTPHKTLVGPGKEVSGIMKLNLYFPDLAKIDDFSDILIFWAYRPPSSKEQPKFGGMLVPKVANKEGAKAQH